MWLNMTKAKFSWDIKGYVTLLTSFSIFPQQMALPQKCIQQC